MGEMEKKKDQHARLGWVLTIFDTSDTVVTTRTCKSLDEIAQTLGLKKGADLAYYIYRGPTEKDKVRSAMLNRFNLWFTVKHVRPRVPETLQALFNVPYDSGLNTIKNQKEP